jgi:hypothetical protein
VIGRDGPVKPFELIRWARQQATAHSLHQTEAQVLLVLATYANADCVAWPSLNTLTADCRRSRRQIVYAIRRLEELQLVWSAQGGNGRSARRELLFNPDPAVRPTALLSDPAVQPAALLEAGAQTPAVQPATPSSAAHRTLSAIEGPELPLGTDPSETSQGTAKNSSAAGRTAVSHPRRRGRNGDNGPRSIGELIRAQGFTE